MATQPTTTELFKYWILTILIVVALGTGVGKLGQAKLASLPSMLIMDQQTKTQIVNRLDQDDTRLNKIDSRITTVETRVNQIDRTKH